MEADLPGDRDRTTGLWGAETLIRVLTRDSVPTEEVVTAAGLTRRPLSPLHRQAAAVCAVFEELEAEVTAEVATAIAAADEGLLVDAPVSVLAHLVFSAVIEAALLIAHAADPAAARADAEQALLALLSGACCASHLDAMTNQPPDHQPQEVAPCANRRPRPEARSSSCWHPESSPAWSPGG